MFRRGSDVSCRPRWAGEHFHPNDSQVGNFWAHFGASGEGVVVAGEHWLQDVISLLYHFFSEKGQKVLPEIHQMASLIRSPIFRQTQLNRFEAI